MVPVRARGTLPAMTKELVCPPNPQLRDRIVLLHCTQSACTPLLRLPDRKCPLVQLVARLLPLQHGFERTVAHINFLLQCFTRPVAQVVPQTNLLLALGLRAKRRTPGTYAGSMHIA